MKALQQKLNLANWYFILFACTAAIVAFLLKKYGYASNLISLSVILIAAGGVLMVVTASIYGILENRFGKEGDQAKNSKAFTRFKQVNSVFLVAETTCVIGVFATLSLISPYYPLILLIPFTFFLIVQKVKQFQNKKNAG